MSRYDRWLAGGAAAGAVLAAAEAAAASRPVEWALAGGTLVAAAWAAFLWYATGPNTGTETGMGTDTGVPDRDADHRDRGREVDS